MVFTFGFLALAARNVWPSVRFFLASAIILAICLACIFWPKALADLLACFSSSSIFSPASAVLSALFNVSRSTSSLIGSSDLAMSMPIM